MKWNKSLVNDRRIGMYEQFELEKHPGQVVVTKFESNGDIEISFGINPITGEDFKNVTEAKKFIEKVFRVFNRI